MKIFGNVFLLIIFVCAFNIQAQTSVDDAVDWAGGQLGSNSDLGCQYNPGGKWAYWCMHFVGHAYNEVPSGFYDAYAGWVDNGSTFGLRKTYNDTNAIPRGALVFFDTAVSEEHVGLYIGNGKVIHAWTSGVVEDNINLIDGRYLGWRWPDDWTGDLASTTKVNCGLLRSFYPDIFNTLGVMECKEAFYYPSDNEYIIYYTYVIEPYGIITSYTVAASFEVNPTSTTVLSYSTSVDIPDDSGDSGTSYDGPDANIKEVELSNYGADSYHHTLTVNPGQNFDVRLGITNKGDEDIDYFEVFVHRSPDLDFNEDTDYSYGREEEEDDLNDGDSTAKHRTCTAPVTPGTYYIFGYINRVDGEDDGEDQDWNNNYSRNDDPEEYGVLIVRDLNPPLEKKKFNPAIYLLLNN